MGHCVKFNPDDDKQHLFVVGSADKKIVTWDTRSNEIVQEYDRHMGAVNTITFCDDNRRYALLYIQPKSGSISSISALVFWIKLI